jgi:hypothetical protein
MPGESSQWHCGGLANTLFNCGSDACGKKIDESDLTEEDPAPQTISRPLVVDIGPDDVQLLGLSGSPDKAEAERPSPELEPKEDLASDLAAAAAPEPNPVAAAEEQPRKVRIDFDDHNGGTHTKYLEYRPLGIIFERKAPITVDSFHANSHLKALGVQVGWTIVRLGDQELSDKYSLQETTTLIRSQISHHKVYPLRLEFITGVETRVFEIEHRPVGIVFQKRLPIIIEKVRPGSVAAEVGITVGLRLVRIGSDDLRVGNYSSIMKRFQSGVSQLDAKPADPT